MRVTIPDAVAVSGTNRFGEIFTVGDNGANATGLSDRGTINISLDDFNPERIQVQLDSGILPDFDADVNLGDSLGDVTGVVGYNFGNFEVNATEIFTPTSAGLEAETTEITNSDSGLTVASYNVLNLDPNDSDGDEDIANGRFSAIASEIVNNLNLPDIIGLQEIQDNDGSVDSDITAADQTLQLLIDEIEAQSGISYEFIDNTFIGDDTSGGQPGGNIRNAFLYNPNRVGLVEDSVQTIGDPGDQQTNEDSPFFDSRLPLVATFTFGDEEITIVDNHFTSKGGSSPLFGQIQPSVELQEDPNVNGGLDERRAQAEAVRNFVDDILAEESDGNVVVLGDLNEFEFISPVETLAESLTNLTETLPEDERYTFIFQGNSQSLDHILVSNNLAETAELDIVHVNTEFIETPQRSSDHDPLIASLNFTSIIEGGNGQDSLIGTDVDESFIGSRGRDIITSGGGNDQIIYNSIVDTGDIITDFEVGSDRFVFTELLNSLDFTEEDPLAKGIIQFGFRSNDSLILIDPDGFDGNGNARTFALVENVAVTELDNSDNFFF